MGVTVSRRSRNLADLLAAVESATLLAFFRICLLVFPVRRIFRALTRGPVAKEPSQAMIPLDDAAMDAVRRVQWAVAGTARHSAVEFVCFPQTLAAYTMLRRRGVSSIIVYGVARSPEGDLMAHTWLEAGDGYVVGGAESEGFAPLERWT
jgi:hypothetical protein